MFHKIVIDGMYLYFGISNIFVRPKKNELVRHNTGKENILFIVEGGGNKACEKLQKLVAKAVAIFLVD